MFYKFQISNLNSIQFSNSYIRYDIKKKKKRNDELICECVFDWQFSACIALRMFMLYSKLGLLHVLLLWLISNNTNNYQLKMSNCCWLLSSVDKSQTKQKKLYWVDFVLIQIYCHLLAILWMDEWMNLNMKLLHVRC